MKYLFFLLLSILSVLNINAQKEANHWFFGGNAGLDFTNATQSINPIADTNGQLNTLEGCATISDASGTLLFYTDGTTVWNKNNQIMPNGTGLFGNSSSTQSAIIVPKPGDVNIYYIFTVDAATIQGLANKGLNYYTVDMSLNGGLGDITALAGIPVATNLLLQPSSEKITAVQAINKIDLWVISFKIDTYYAFKITSNGVDSTNPIKSFFSNNISDRRGYLKASPDGKFLASANMTDGFYFYDFDNATGIVSNPRELNLPFTVNTSGSYGVAFSALSKKLYISSGGFDNTQQTRENLYQFNLDIPNLTATNINNTRVLLHSYLNSRAALQLAPDGKIYRTVDEQSRLSVINNPDAFGTASDYRHAVIDLGGPLSKQGLPPFIQSFFVADIQVVNTCFGDATEFLVNSSEPILSMITDFGDGTPTSTSLTPTHTYAISGNFTVSTTITTASETKTFTKEFSIYAIPTATTPTNWLVCDDDNDGFYGFDLSQKNNDIILNGQDPDIFSVSYFSDDALTQEIKGIHANNIAYRPETIYVRVANKDNLTCAVTTSFVINVFDSPKPALATDIPNIEVCDDTLDGNDPNGFATFDLTLNETILRNGQSSLYFDIAYFTDADLIHPISTPADFPNSIVNGQTIYVSVTNKLNVSCFVTTSFNIVVNPMPVIEPSVTLKQCDVDTDGISDFNLTESEVLINSQMPTPTFSYYLNLGDAQIGDLALAINNTSVFSNATTNIVFARVENAFGCYRVAQVNLLVSTTHLLANFMVPLETCDDTDEDGFTSFDLTQASTAILNNFPPGQNLTVKYYRNNEDALAEKNEINATNYINETPYSQNIVVRVESLDNNECKDLGTHVSLTVNPLPQFDLTESQFVCLNDLPLTVTVTNPAANYDYVWRDTNGNQIGTNAPNVAIISGGTYTVTATKKDGTLCSKTKSITITESVTATIVDMTIVDDSDNNSIAVNITGTGDYEIALDDLNDFNPFVVNSSLPGRTHVFSNVTAGIHKVFIRDKNGCGLTIKDAIVIGFPHFLTPNGDGINDTWNVAGASLQPNSLIYIFDRFGKLLAKVNPTGSGWDGTFNGRKLPSNDYWFTARLQDGRIRKGHFSLVRR